MAQSLIEVRISDYYYAWLLEHRVSLTLGKISSSASVISHGKYLLFHENFQASIPTNYAV